MGTEKNLVPVLKSFRNKSEKCILPFNEPHESYGFGLNQFLYQCNLKKEGSEKHNMINENV